MDLLNERVFLIDERIIYVRELEKPNPETISLSAARVRELARDFEQFGIIVEFPKNVVPDADTRHRVIAEMSLIKEKLEHIGIVTKNNVFINLTVRFVGTFIGMKSFTMHNTKDEALKEILSRRQKI